MVDIFDRLRDLPDEQFRITLKERLMQAASTSTEENPLYVPAGFRTITPYLITHRALELMEFMKNAFGATEKMRALEPSGRLMHGEMIIDDSVVEISDGSEQYPPSPVALHLYVRDVDTTYARALALGAASLFEPADQPYGHRAAGLRDIGGNHWHLATHLNLPDDYRPHGTPGLMLFLRPEDPEHQIQFLVNGLGGQETRRNTHGGIVQYAQIRIGTGLIEVTPARGEVRPMPASVHVHVPDCDAVYHQALAAGGTSIHPLTDQPYGERSGGVLDPFGNRWWIATVTVPR